MGVEEGEEVEEEENGGGGGKGRRKKGERRGKEEEGKEEAEKKSNSAALQELHSHVWAIVWPKPEGSDFIIRLASAACLSHAKD